MAEPIKLLTIQFLDWLDVRPRSYGEMGEAWKSSCPLNSAWEDALAAGLVECDSTPGESAKDARLRLTAAGRSVLEAYQRQNAPRQLAGKSWAVNP